MEFVPPTTQTWSISIGNALEFDADSETEEPIQTAWKLWMGFGGDVAEPVSPVTPTPP